MEIVGKIIQALPEQSGTGRNGNPWRLQSFILETQEQYARKVCVEMFGEERIKANPWQIDDVVTVSFDLESREFNGRWYTSVRAWRIQQGVVTAQPAAAPVAAPVAAAAPAAPAAPAANVTPFDPTASGDSSELPF